MKKLYEKPDVEYVELVAQEPINKESLDVLEGDMGLESSIF